MNIRPVLRQKDQTREPTGTSQRGSALIASLLFTATLGAIVLPSYFKLSYSTFSLANRNFYRNAALSLAESGLEHAMWALNSASDGGDPWGSWTQDGDDIETKVTGFSYGGSVEGEILVRILDFESEVPEALTMATITLSNGEVVHRYMHARLASASVPAVGGGLFAYGMLARDFIQASGGVAFDSWISDPDGDPSTPYVPYSAGVARDKSAIGVASTADNAINLGSSDVYGTAAIGSNSLSGINVGWGGQVGPADPNEWDASDTQNLWMKDPPGWKVSLSTGALTTGFVATFEEITVPEALNPTLQAPYVLPRNETKRVCNEWSCWDQNVYVSTDDIGSDGGNTVIQMGSLEVSGGATLTIRGDVTLILPNEGFENLRVIAGGSLRLADGAKLTVYNAGHTTISGAGLLNDIQPKQLQLWGTSTTTQNITFQGSGSMSGVIYAPNANISLPGGTNIYGAVVGKAITMAGSGSFHFDESLESFSGWSNPDNDAPDGGERAAVLHVGEISPSEYLAYLNS